MDGLPFDDSSWIIPHRNGRIYDESALQFYPGEYVAGWIKRGPSGSLPHIRSGAEETVSAMLEGLHLGQVRYHSVKIYSGRAMVVSAEKKFYSL